MNRGFRRGQLVGVHGPGAIIDIGSESFVVTSIDKWRKEGMTNCNLPRLSTMLDVSSLKQPKVNGSYGSRNPSVSLFRFPQWLFCQREKCRRMVKWSRERERSLENKRLPFCEYCRGNPELVPMRFVQVCEKGHLNDVDWNWWVHHQDGVRDQCHGRDSLQFLSRAKAGSGLDSLLIKCTRCGVTRKLGDLNNYKGFKCRSETAFSGGTQPWQRSDSGTPCDSEAVIVQRGDSNTYFPKVVSALDIPAVVSDQGGEQDVLIKANKDFQKLESAFELYSDVEGINRDHFLQVFERKIDKLSEVLGVEPNKIKQLLEKTSCKSSDHEEPAISADVLNEIKREEFSMLSAPDSMESNHFSGTSYEIHEKDLGANLAGFVESISLIDRLREVRAIRGFHRVSPAREERMVKVDLGLSPSGWLPACEVFGEGIFLKFRSDALTDFEHGLPDVERRRLESLQARIDKDGLSFLPQVSARFIAIHSLSHLLIKQLCYDCGYASSSLRERLYVDDNMAGLLIYTADGDSEGTLGGLVRQGRSDRLPQIFASALKDAAWCSGDPLCSEGENQGMAGLNRAACHTCLLVSETSCECANALLDRRFLISEDAGLKGFLVDSLADFGIV